MFSEIMKVWLDFLMFIIGLSVKNENWYILLYVIEESGGFNIIKKCDIIFYLLWSGFFL